MKTLYRIGGAVYEREGDRLLLKAKSTPSPGQLSMFEESAHHRDESGKFSSGGGSAKASDDKAPNKDKTPSGAGSTGIAVKAIVKEVNTGHMGKPDADEIQSKSLNPDHPGSSWDEETFETYMDLYRKDPDSFATAVRDHIMSGDVDDREWMVKGAFQDFDNEAFGEYTRSLLDGKPRTPPSGAIAEVVANSIREEIKYLQDSEDPDSALDLKDWRAKVESGSLGKSFKKLALRDPGFNEQITEAYSKQIDWDSVSTSIAQRLQLPKAAQVEAKQGFAGIYSKPRSFAVKGAGWDGKKTTHYWSGDSDLHPESASSQAKRHESFSEAKSSLKALDRKRRGIQHRVVSILD